jgi:hypothetical protein
MRNLTLTIQICDISQSFVSATKYENISTYYEYCGHKNWDIIFLSVLKKQLA